MGSQTAKERMISAASSLFHHHGINGTSVDDVLKLSKTGKSQFTHYFKNKDGLVLAVIEKLFAIIKNGQAPTGYHISTWQDFEKWFPKYINFQKSVNYELSCPLGTMGGELTNEQIVLRQSIELFFEWCTEQLANFFAGKKAAGELSAAANPKELADLCLTVMEGGMLMAKIKRNPRTFKNASVQVLNYVKLLRIKKKRN